MVTLRFSDYGACLATRELGHEVADKIHQLLTDKEKIALDFAGVQMITLSFSDEMFGALIIAVGLDKLKENTQFVNADPTIRAVLAASIGLNNKVPLVTVQQLTKRANYIQGA